MAEMGYRDDTLYGDGYVDAARVLTYEIGELGNYDVLEYLAMTCLVGTDIGEQWPEVNNDVEVDEFFEARGGVEHFVRAELLPAIAEATGVRVSTVRWLCRTVDDVVNAYGADPDNVTAYPVGDVLLSDLGVDGQLWGYA
jgi:hypothetical protein